MAAGRSSKHRRAQKALGYFSGVPSGGSHGLAFFFFRGAETFGRRKIRGYCVEQQESATIRRYVATDLAAHIAAGLSSSPQARGSLSLQGMGNISTSPRQDQASGGWGWKET